MSAEKFPDKYLFGFAYDTDVDSRERLLPFLPDGFFAKHEADVLRAHDGFLAVIAANVSILRCVPTFIGKYVSRRHENDLKESLNLLESYNKQNTLLQLYVSSEGFGMVSYSLRLFSLDGNARRSFLLEVFSMCVFEPNPIKRRNIGENWQQNNTEFCHEWLYSLVDCFETIRLATLQYKAAHCTS